MGFLNRDSLVVVFLHSYEMFIVIVRWGDAWD